MCTVECIYLFFFFKQKTAYEMRISDWSSDVCSSDLATGHWLAYAVRDLDSGTVVGTSSFLNIKPERCCVEIGATFLHPSVRSGYVNPDAKKLMLAHAFASGARRVELLTDLRNAWSQAAIAKLGAIREGVLRRDRKTWTGHIRDTAVFSITRTEDGRGG